MPRNPDASFEEKNEFEIMNHIMFLLNVLYQRFYIVISGK